MNRIKLPIRERIGNVQQFPVGVDAVVAEVITLSWYKLEVARVHIIKELTGTNRSSRSATVHEEAMLAIRALTYAAGPYFSKYMSEFYKYVEMGLQKYEEYQVCVVTVGVVGDICRALEDKVMPYCDGIMTNLLKDLSSNPCLNPFLC
ncbi:hypothetical protein AgCh_034177 [Apium graveolens]